MLRRVNAERSVGKNGLKIDDLKTLARLRAEGVLTDAEFTAAKSQALGLG